MPEEFSGDYFQWLRGFYHVARTGSVSAAARILNLSQPTVSHQIKSLEENYGVTLFARSKGGMTLTPEGRDMLDHVIVVFDSVKEIADRFCRNTSVVSGKITIVSTHSLIMYYLAPYVTAFKKKYPEVSFELVGGMLDTIEKAVDSGAADFGVSYLNALKGNYQVHKLFSTSLSLIAGKANLFNLQPEISIPEIGALPFVGYPPNSTIKDLVYRRFRQEGCDISSIITLNNLECLKRFVKLDLGVSIIYDYALTEHDRTRLQVINLTGILGEIPIGVVTRKRKYLGPGVKKFLSVLTSH